MNQMNRIESKLDQVLEHLAKLTGQQPSTGVTETPAGAVFMPGTGTLGASHPDKPEPGPIPASEDERRRIVEAARANIDHPPRPEVAMSRSSRESTPHPVKGVLAMRRIKNRSVARTLGVSERYLGDVINALVIPSSELTLRFAELLEAPVDELFRLDDEGRVKP